MAINITNQISHRDSEEFFAEPTGLWNIQIVGVPRKDIDDFLQMANIPFRMLMWERAKWLCDVTGLDKAHASQLRLFFGGNTYPEYCI